MTILSEPNDRSDGEAELSILEIGNTILTQVAQAVENPSAADLIELEKKMIESCDKAQGVGLAGPQIGLSLRLFLLSSKPTVRYPEAPLLPPQLIINPEIKSHSEEQIKGWEGCLSIPGFRGQVPRWKSIEVRYWNTAGQEVNEELEDFVARVFQHELDHLNGILYPARMEAEDRLLTLGEYEEEMKRV